MFNCIARFYFNNDFDHYLLLISLNIVTSTSNLTPSLGSG